MRELVIIGAGGLGREIAWVAQEIAEYENLEVLGFIDDNKSLWDSEINGLRVLGGRDWLRGRENVYAVLGIGDPRVKREVVGHLGRYVRWATLIHPNAHVSQFNHFGEGTVVFPGSAVTTNVKTGEHALIYLGCTVGHEVIIGNYVTLLPGCNVGGSTCIKDGVLVGSGSNIIQGMKVGAWSKVGAGAVVINDVPSESTVVGVPAEVVR